MPFNIGLPLIWLANEVLFLLRVCNRLSQPMYVLPYLLYGYPLYHLHHTS